MEYPMRIGGEAVRSEQPWVVHLPYDGSAVGTVFQADKQQVDAAIASAKAAAPLMREMTLSERGAILRKSYQLLMDRLPAFAQAISSESGKPIKEARIEAERSASTLLFSSEEAHRLHGEVVPMDASPAGRGH